MALNRDSLQTIIDRIDADIASNLPNYVTGLRQSVEYVLARALGGVVHGLHGHLVYLSKQLFPDTAEGEYLERIAGVYGIERIDGVQATGTITAFTTAAGIVIPAGTIWVSPTGVRFSQDADATSEEIETGIYGQAFAVTAVEKGVNGNIATLVSLTIETPQISVTGDATSNGISAGADDETDAALLARLLLRLRNPPRGGAETDYEIWALETPDESVTRAWAIAQQFGVGTVGVTFVQDGNGVGAAIIPDTDSVSAVQAYIDAQRPATADARVFAPTIVTIDMTINTDPEDETVQNNIADALADYFARSSAPGATLYVSQIREVISGAVGEVNHELPTILIDDVEHTPPIDIIIPSDSIAILGNFTFGGIA